MSINGTHAPLCTLRLRIEFPTFLLTCLKHRLSRLPSKMVAPTTQPASPVAWRTSQSPPLPAATLMTFPPSWDRSRRFLAGRKLLTNFRGRPGICPTATRTRCNSLRPCSISVGNKRDSLCCPSCTISYSTPPILTHSLSLFTYTVIIDQADFWCQRILPWAQTDQIHFKCTYLC